MAAHFKLIAMCRNLLQGHSLKEDFLARFGIWRRTHSYPFNTFSHLFAAASVVFPSCVLMDIIFGRQKFWGKWSNEQLIKCIPAAIVWGYYWRIDRNSWFSLSG